MATPDDDDCLKDDEDMFAPTGGSQLSVLNFDSDILVTNMVDFASHITDDAIPMPQSTQEFVSQGIADFIPSSVDPTGKYPTTEEFCNPATTFLVPMASTQGAGYVYSTALKKLYIKADSTCSFAVQCNVPAGKEFFLRAMLVSVVPESRHVPLLRCRNHQAKDEGTDNECLKEHVVRCKNEQHEYVGGGTGAFFEDRCAVRVPLRSGEACTVETELLLQFVCQNTCFNPAQRKIALVFTLEDTHGHIWGRRIQHIKICTNYRRDMVNEENADRTKKAKIQTGKRAQPVGRPRKRRMPDEGAGTSSRWISSNRKLTVEPYHVTLEMPSMRMAKRVLDSAIGIISASVLRVDDELVKADLMQYVERLRNQRQSLSFSNSQCSVDSVLL